MPANPRRKSKPDAVEIIAAAHINIRGVNAQNWRLAIKESAVFPDLLIKRHEVNARRIASALRRAGLLKET